MMHKRVKREAATIGRKEPKRERVRVAERDTSTPRRSAVQIKVLCT